MLCRTDTCSISDEAAINMAYRAGPGIVKGLLAALLAVSALSRVHKVCTIFLELTGIQHTGGQAPANQVVKWLQLSVQQLAQGGSSYSI